MRFWFLATTALAFVVLAVAAGWMIVSSRGTHAPQLPRPAVETIRLEPPAEAGEEIETEPYAHVHYVYLVRNNGAEPIRHLKVALTCQCEAAEEPPEEIAPGESARVGFRIRPAEAGVVKRRVDLITEGTRDVLSSLDVAIRVKFEPPALAHRPGQMRVTFLDGDETPPDLTFESIEKAGSTPWINGLDVEPKSLVQLTAIPPEESPHLDEGLIRRVYRFRFSRGTLPPGNYAGSFRLRTRRDPPAMPSHFPLELEVLDRVAIIPTALRLAPVAGKLEPAQVFVVRRSGNGRLEVAQWDRDLLDVRRVGDRGERAATFSVAAKTLPKNACETKIVFNVGDGQTRELRVAIAPPGPLPKSL